MNYDEANLILTNAFARFAPWIPGETEEDRLYLSDFAFALFGFSDKESPSAGDVLERLDAALSKYAENLPLRESHTDDTLAILGGGPMEADPREPCPRVLAWISTSYEKKLCEVIEEVCAGEYETDDVGFGVCDRRSLLSCLTDQPERCASQAYERFAQRFVRCRLERDHDGKHSDSCFEWLDLSDMMAMFGADDERDAGNASPH